MMAPRTGHIGTEVTETLYIGTVGMCYGGASPCYAFRLGKSPRWRNLSYRRAVIDVHITFAMVGEPYVPLARHYSNTLRG